MTISSLATDPTFDPADYRHRADTKPEHLRNSECAVCGVKYAPGGVCGYCRAKVAAVRSVCSAAKGDS